MQPAKVAIVGCGNICEIYFTNAKRLEAIEVVACCDRIPDRAQAKAAQHDIRACTFDEVLGDTSIDIVLNLTVPGAHAEVAIAALEAGKSVYNEKPLAITREDGQRMLALAADKNLRVGAAPDTFLGAGLQTCRKLIDDGWIGEPVAATAFVMGHGHESWHPDPAYYYQPGAGPLFDMGPYYLTALLSLVGPMRRVGASARATFAERRIASEPKRGEIIPVNTPTHIAATIDHHNGAITTLAASFDVWHATLPPIEIHGTEGSLGVPDPNTFGGAVRLRRHDADAWTPIPHSHPYAEDFRGLGLADMAAAIHADRPHRANGAMAYHVLDVMHACLESSEQGRHITLDSTCARPAPFPLGLTPGKVSTEK
jgi:predicted dehydrogenase